ncbi:MAG: hypothetical protein ACR2NP_15275 [Pirellulaceae bacterium]
MSQSGINFVHSPESIIEIITPLNRIIDRQESVECQRILPRRRIVTPIRVQLLDEDMKPSGEPLQGLSQDITMGGMGFLCLSDVTAPFAQVQFHEQLGEHHPLLIEIKHSRRMGPFCQVGGSFRVDWS